jgi:hypothetical protein
MAKVVFKAKVPPKLDALVWAVTLILFPAPAVFSGAAWSWLVALPCFSVAGVMLLSIVAPKAFLSGVRLIPGGFEFRAPLRVPRAVQYKDIKQIDAVVGRDGDMGLTFIDLVVHSQGRKIRLQEGSLAESGLLAQIEALRGFNLSAYTRAQQYEPSGLRQLWPKRFRVFNAT